MDEYVRRIYRKEEEFLEEFYGTVEAALPLFGEDWEPNYSCNDQVRNDVARQLRHGTAERLTFEDAAIFYGRHGFSSIRLYLRSSQRYVVVRIACVGSGLLVERLGNGTTKWLTQETRGVRRGGPST